MKISDAIIAAADARKERLTGKYHLASQILANEVFRLRSELEKLSELKKSKSKNK